MTESSTTRKRTLTRSGLALSQSRERSLEAERADLIRNNPSINVSGLLQYFQDNYPKALDILSQGGIHPSGISQFTDLLSGKSIKQDFRNIGEHSLAVGLAASRICDELIRVAIITETEKQHIVHRALIHDAAKAAEIITETSIADLVAEQSSDTFEKVRILKENLSCLQEKLESPGTETGHLALKNFLNAAPSGRRELCRGKLSEKVVRLADDMTASVVPGVSHGGQTFFVTPNERIAIGQCHIRYPELYRSGLGVKRFLYGAKLLELSDIHSPLANTVVLGSYVALQAFVANSICSELKSHIAPTHPLPAEQFMKRIINAE